MANNITDSQKIINACEAKWNTWKSDCSGFLKAVAQELGVAMSAGQANGIVDWLDNSSTWLRLGTDKASANLHANQGFFVVGGSKSSGHGHVAIIVSGGSSARPNGYWGRLGTIGKKNESITWSWGQAALPDVKFYAIRLPG